MRQNSHIALSDDGQKFTVILPIARIIDFSSDGTFWIWDNNAALTQSRAFYVAAHNPCRPDFPHSGLPLSAEIQFAALISYTGSVHEFLHLHFRVGHLNYTAILRALQAGTWTGFQHSL